MRYIDKYSNFLKKLKKMKRIKKPKLTLDDQLIQTIRHNKRTVPHYEIVP